MSKHLGDILILVLLATLSSACIFKPNEKIKVEQNKRTFTLHLPKGYSDKKDPYPILFVLHGKVLVSANRKIR